MTKEIPDYNVGENKFYFQLHGREIAAEVNHWNPEKWNGIDMSGLNPEDMEFTVDEITDGNTGESIQCTKEIRALIAVLIHDHMS